MAYYGGAKDAKARIRQIDSQLTVSRSRQMFYRAVGDDASDRIEGQVQDRLLDERNALTGELGS